MRATRKKLTIEIEYGDVQELQRILFGLSRTMLRTPKKYDRFKTGTAITEWVVQTEEQDYTEQEINGVWCMVYRSIM